MKKVCSILLSMALLVSLAACSGGEPAESEGGASQAPASSPEVPAQPASDSAESSAVPEEPSSSGEPVAPEDSDEAGGTLIAYFSWSGNTERMARAIQAEIGGDLFKIEPATPYTEEYDALLDIARQEQAEDARPELAAQVENWDGYDVIFAGFPNWWSDAPMAVYTFLEAYDFTGKTLIPFNTSASGGFGRSLSGIGESAAGATILEGLALTEGELGNVQSEVSGWLAGLGLE